MTLIADPLAAFHAPVAAKTLAAFLAAIPSADAPRSDGAAVGRALGDTIRGRRALLIEEIDGAPAGDAPIAAALVDTGFVRTAGGLLRRAAG